MSMVETSFNIDESTCPPTLLKSDFNTEIFQVQKKFQNRFFKVHLYRNATALQKAYFLRACYEIRS